MPLEERIKEDMEASIALKQRAMRDLKPVAEAARLLIEVFSSGKRAFFCGNGGSAADAQHLAAELLGKFRKVRPSLPALALHTNTSAVTAIANDFSYDEVFVRQLEGLAGPGDALIGISTSGCSANVVNAVRWGAEHGMITIGLTGEGGGDMKPYCKVLLEAPSHDTPRIQELHITWGHIICALVEERLFP